jgi:antagonist of KipI
MQIRIDIPGLLSTIQDGGRPLYRSQAVPVSGAMDTLSARLTNLAVGNTPKKAVVEFTYAAASFTTLTPVLIAWSGGGAVLQVGIKPLPANRPIFLPANTTVQLVRSPTGCRTYLAVAGGWDIPEIMGSSSTYLTAGFGGYFGRALQKGDVLNAHSSRSSLTQKIVAELTGDAIRFANWYLSSKTFLPPVHNIIRVMQGQECDWFTEDAITLFFSQPFTVGGQSNRMGYQLEGSHLGKKTSPELLSTAVMPGTVQVAGNGQPILLMADCQTTGGYTRIAQVAAVDMPLCGQLKPGDTVYFRKVSNAEAEKLYLERERKLAALALAIEANHYL